MECDFSVSCVIRFFP